LSVTGSEALELDVAQHVDQRVMLRRATWLEYEALLAMRGDSAVPRITYLEGVLELMSPSRNHEQDKKLLARLVEAYAEELAIDLFGIGSWTLKREEADRGAEPDECYSIGPVSDDDMPALAIEVVKTRGGISKLEVYRGLGVGEVWFWKDERITVFVLEADRYREVQLSRLLPAIDMSLLAELVKRGGSQLDAVRELRRRVRSQPQGK
jgi:Uma2 family endonuclease